jgi:hypothetical protein
MTRPKYRDLEGSVWQTVLDEGARVRVIAGGRRRRLLLRPWKAWRSRRVHRREAAVGRGVSPAGARGRTAFAYLDQGEVSFRTGNAGQRPP